MYIYKKLSPKWKKFQEQKVFFFRFYILCENFSKIGPIIKKIPKFQSDPLKNLRKLLLFLYGICGKDILLHVMLGKARLKGQIGNTARMRRWWVYMALTSNVQIGTDRKLSLFENFY